MAMHSPTTIARFWSKVDVRPGMNECWEWRAAKTTAGYGKMKVSGVMYIASRLAWEIFNGRTLSDSLVARHACDNPACCNPEHIQPGTQTQNMQDMVSRGRHRPAGMPGETNPRAKLTQSDVQEIRARIARGETNVSIARDYPVTHALISRIRQGSAWR
jgi:hypothetical protein